MFRDEAGALIALPHHPNLARFVTFDAGCKPKPILVMELVEGITLERLLQSRGLDAPRALALLDDVLKGLEAMHSIGVGHLDLKPSNVVMRKGEQAVLVDFGLAGRHIRPGCATAPYGAPEVWGALESKAPWLPSKADIYAFGCVAYETMTGKTLFEGESEMALVTKHIAHDGMPPRVKALVDKKTAPGLAEFLYRTLRRHPNDRPSATELRKELGRITPALAKVKWPIDAA
jgi:serine/threonine protein kinase